MSDYDLFNFSDNTKDEIEELNPNSIFVKIKKKNEELKRARQLKAQGKELPKVVKKGTKDIFIERRYEKKKRPFITNVYPVLNSFLISTTLLSSFINFAPAVSAAEPDVNVVPNTTISQTGRQLTSLSSYLQSSVQDLQQLQALINAGVIDADSLQNIYNNLKSVETLYNAGEAITESDRNDIQVLYNSLSAIDITNLQVQGDRETAVTSLQGSIDILSGFMGISDAVSIQSDSIPITINMQGSMSNFVRGTPLTFNDVSSADWFYDSVSKASAYHILEGDAGLFNPQGSLSIAQALTIAARMNSIYFGVTLPNGATSNHWAEGTLQYAEANNIVSKGTYSLSDLDRSATRAEMLEMFFNALPSSEYSNFLNSGTTAKTNNETVRIMYQAGIVTGDDNGNLNETSAITRAEAATIILRIIDSSERVVDNGVTSGYIYVSPELTQSQTQTSDNLYYSDTVKQFQSQFKYINFVEVPGMTAYYTYHENLPTRNASATTGSSSIQTHYGLHIYNVRNQAEYDAVIAFGEKIVNKAIQTFDMSKHSTSKIIDMYFAGEDTSGLSANNKKGIDNFLNNMCEGITDKNQQYELYTMSSFMNYLIEVAEDEMRAVSNPSSPNTGNTNNPYDLLSGALSGLTCEGNSQIVMVLGDILGLPTRQIGSTQASHSVGSIKVNDAWWTPGDGASEKLWCAKPSWSDAAVRINSTTNITGEAETPQK